MKIVSFQIYCIEFYAQHIQETSDKGSKVMSIFSKTLSDLTEGEMLQMEKAFGHDTTQEDYIRIIYCDLRRKGRRRRIFCRRLRCICYLLYCLAAYRGACR